jgi:hypothetical protein
VKDPDCVWMSARILKSIPLLPLSLLETLFNGLSYLFAAACHPAHARFWKQRTVSSWLIFSCGFIRLSLSEIDDMRYYAPLSALIKSGATIRKIAWFIKKNPGSIDERGPMETTLLRTAVYKKNINVVKLLLDHGADLSDRDASFSTVWEYIYPHLRSRRSLERVDFFNSFIECVISTKKKYEIQSVLELPSPIKSLIVSYLDFKDERKLAKIDTTINELLSLKAIQYHQRTRSSLLCLQIHHCLGNSSKEIKYCKIEWNARKTLKLCPDVQEIIFCKLPKDISIEELQNAFKKEFPEIHVDPTFSNNCTYALHTAVQNDSFEEISELLKREYIFINACDKSRNTPLYYAVARQDVKMIKLLLQHNAHVNGNPSNILYLTEELRNQEIIDILKAAL